jgi:CBS domain containing-hemolysin-like protein
MSQTLAILAGLLLVLAGVLRAGVSSLLAISQAEAVHEAVGRRRGAALVARLLERRLVVVPAVNIVHLGLLVTATAIGAFLLGSRQLADVVVAGLAALVLGVLAVGDLVPRAVGRSFPGGIAYLVAPLLAVAVRVGSRAADMMGEEDEPDEPEEEADEIEMISSVLEFSETIVREVMVPRTDIVAIPVDATLEELMRTISEHGYSRIPVVGEDLDDVRGVVIVKDLLLKLAGGERPRSVAEVMRPVEFVPETKRAADLLREMQASRSHLAIVVDEYGGTAGLITIEDLLEELVGEIVDEYDEDEDWITEQPDGTWLVNGKLPVADLAEATQAELPDGEWDTVAGLVMGLAGRVPEVGERFVVDGVVLVPTRVQGRRVVEVSVARRAGIPE